MYRIVTPHISHSYTLYYISLISIGESLPIETDNTWISNCNIPTLPLTLVQEK